MSPDNKESNPLSYVGQRIPRKDGPEKVTGRAKYTGDIHLSGMLVGRILRSPHPHARILNIDGNARRLGLSLRNVNGDQNNNE